MKREIAIKNYDRIEIFLSEVLKISKSQIVKKFSFGEILIFKNGKKLEKLGNKVLVGDKIEFEILQEKKFQKKLEIIFENKDFFAVEKDVGILSVDENFQKESMVSIALENFSNQKNEFSKNENFGLVHRLDKDTSGVLLFAKTKKFYGILKNLFREKKIQKTYQAICVGKYSGNLKGTIKTFLEKHNQKVFVAEKNKNSVFSETDFEIIKKFQTDEKDLEIFFVNAFPKTGRMHQIRVSLAEIGLPVFGDKLYSKLKNGNFDLKSFIKRKKDFELNFLKNFDRMMLHAKKIEFLDFKIESRISLF